MGTITSREACVDHVIGSAYQVVRYVAANMQSIIDVSDAMPQLELWMPNIASVLAAMPVISNVNANLPVITNVNSNLTMLAYKSFAWSTLGATPDITPNITLTDPGVYVAFLRTTSNASAWKAARKVNATPSLRMGTDPASKVLMDTLQPRWSIAWKFTSIDPLVVDWTVSY